MRLFAVIFTLLMTPSLYADQAKIANAFVNCVSLAVDHDSKTASFAKMKADCIGKIKDKNGANFSELKGILVPPSVIIQILEESTTPNTTYMKVLVKYDVNDTGRILLGSFGRGVDLYGNTAGGGSHSNSNGGTFGSNGLGSNGKDSVNGHSKNKSSDKDKLLKEGKLPGGLEITEDRVSSPDFCRKRLPGQTAEEVLHSGLTYGTGFRHVDGECVRMCPSGTVYRNAPLLGAEFDPAKDCTKCTEDPHAVPWVSSLVRSDFSTTNSTDNRCTDEIGCSMGQTMVTWPDGTRRCAYGCCFGQIYNEETKQCESVPSYCSENTNSTRSLARWNNMEKLRTIQYGTCSGERLYTLALMYKNSFEYALQDNQARCVQEQVRLVNFNITGGSCSNYVPPTFNMYQVFKQNCNPAPQSPSTPVYDPVLSELLQSVGSIPAYDDLIN